MAVYNVYMGQGMTVPNLGEDTFITGPGRIQDRLQSCAAVMLFNTATRAAGLSFPVRRHPDRRQFPQRSAGTCRIRMIRGDGLSSS